MASKKQLKKDFQVKLERLASQVYFPLVEGSEAQQKKADELLGKLSESLNDFSAKVSQIKAGDKTKEAFAEIKKDFAQQIQSFESEISSIKKG